MDVDRLLAGSGTRFLLQMTHLLSETHPEVHARIIPDIRLFVGSLAGPPEQFLKCHHQKLYFTSETI